MVYSLETSGKSNILTIDGKQAAFGHGDLYYYTNDLNGDLIFIYEVNGVFKNTFTFQFAKDRLIIDLSQDSFTVNGKSGFTTAGEVITELDKILFQQPDQRTIVDTFGQLVTAFAVRDIAVKWEFEVYETGNDMLPAELSGDGVQSFDRGMLVASSAASGTAKLRSKKVTRYRTGNGGFAWFTAIFSGGSGYVGLESDNGDKIIIRKVLGQAQVGYEDAEGFTLYFNDNEFNGQVNVNEITWDNLNVFQVRYGYLGSADLEFFIKIKGQLKLLHRIDTAGQISETHIRFPQMRMAMFAANGGLVKCGSWNAGTYSNVLEDRGSDPAERPFNVSVTREDYEPTPDGIPLLGLKVKDQYNGFIHNVEVKIILAIFATSSEGFFEYDFLLNPANTNGSYEDYDSLSSVVQFNSNLTSFSGGEKRLAVPIGVPTSGRNSEVLTFDFEKLGVKLQRGDELIIVMKEIDGRSGTDNQIISINGQELF